MAADAFETFVTHARTDEERRFIPLGLRTARGLSAGGGDPDAAPVGVSRW